MGFNVNDGVYTVTTKSAKSANVIDGEEMVNYDTFREMFEAINERLVQEGVGKGELKGLKKAFPSKELFRKENNDKVMRQRRDKLNAYFKTLIDFALNDRDDQASKAGMIVM